MLALLKTKPADTVLINTYNELNWETFEISLFDTAIYFVDKALELENNILKKEKPGSQLYKRVTEYKAVSLMYRAGTNLSLSNFPEALSDNRLALDVFKQLGDKEGVANSLFGIGGVYKNMGYYPEALQNHFAALKIRDSLNDKRSIAASYNNIGSIYKALKNYDKSLEYMLRSLQIKKETGDRKGMGNSYNNIANIYAIRKDFDAALKNHLIALQIRTEASDKRGIGVSNENLGNLYAEKGELERSIEYFTTALKIYKEINDRSGISTVLISFCDVYMRMNKLDDAEKNGLEGLLIAREIGELDNVRLAFENLSETLNKKGDFKKALHYYKNFIMVRDSLMNEENTKKSVQSEMQYEFDKKEAATKAEQEKKDTIAAADKRRQKIILWATSGFGLLILLFSLFAWRSFLQKKKANYRITRQKEVIEEKQKEILDSLFYARRIQRSLLPNLRYIERVLLKLKKEI